MWSHNHKRSSGIRGTNYKRGVEVGARRQVNTSLHSYKLYPVIQKLV